MTRFFTTAVLAAGAVLALFCGEAAALGCWVCAHSYDTCIYYTEGEYGDFWRGCDRMFPGHGANWEACMYDCDARRFERQQECQANREWCEDNCGPRDPIDPGCPIVLDLGRERLKFTSPEKGVQFDIDGDGQREQIAWTDVRGGDGFLTLDQNDNGRIDSGFELFGDVSWQAPTLEPQGFLAMAMFDQLAQGGNADGMLSDADQIWGKLRVWVDVDHDGESQPEELTTLREQGILSIDLGFHETRRRDRHGNELRFRSRVRRLGAPTVAVDVFFRVLP